MRRERHLLALIVMSATQNDGIATRLEEAAQLLRDQHANPYRVRAYQHGAQTVRQLGQPVSELIAAGGAPALAELPGIGDHLSRSIYQLVKTGRLPLLDRLRGDTDPIEVIASVSGIGERTAQRIHERLGVNTLEELEAAAHDGRLAHALGFGAKRLAGIRDALAGRLGRVRRSSSDASHEMPGVAELLDVDAQYRREAQQGSLKLIAPRRFNPEGKAWLPVLHCVRGSRHYTALFSNTAHAHQVHRTHDWVVIYVDGAAAERQFTVITSTRGPLVGQRIVRGREAECLDHYRACERAA